MKSTLLLAFAASFLIPHGLAAQVPVPPGAGTPPAAGGAATGGIAPATSPGAPRLPSVDIEEATLLEVVRLLQAKAQQAGHDTAVDPLNVVITPGLEELRVPSLSLRNVTPTDVLTVATTVLGLQIDPVIGDTGQPSAWIIKTPPGAMPGIGMAGPTPLDPNAAGPQGFASGAPGGYTSAPVPGTSASLPYALQLAASSGSGMTSPGGGAARDAVSRVFGVAALVASNNKNDQSREDERARKLQVLLRMLEKMVDDHGGKAQINAYTEMDLIVVKSGDPAVLSFVAEAIDAMKSNQPRARNAAPLDAISPDGSVGPRKDARERPSPRLEVKEEEPRVIPADTVDPGLKPARGDDLPGRQGR